MFTPIDASGNFVAELFLDWNKRKKSNKKNYKMCIKHVIKGVVERFL